MGGNGDRGSGDSLVLERAGLIRGENRREVQLRHGGQDLEDTEDVEDITENIEDTENTEDTEKTEDTEDTQDMEDTEDIEVMYDKKEVTFIIL